MFCLEGIRSVRLKAEAGDALVHYRVSVAEVLPDHLTVDDLFG